VIDAEDDAPSPEERIRRGAVLRVERERQELRAADVATRLNLRTSFVQAIEEGRGEEHMAWSYERIHHRSIAAMLGIEMVEGS
jgi:cytoskeletal protein RodZ